MYPMAHFRSLLRVYHKDKEGAPQSLQNFDLSEKVFDAISSGERSISTSLLSPGDLKKLKQMGLWTENEVDVVVELLWDGPSLLAIVAKANDTQLRRQVLLMAVDRIRKTKSLKKILALKGLPKCTIRENPYLAPGHAPYENFIESLLNVTDTSTPDGKTLFELFVHSAADEADETTLTLVEKWGLRTVFHGTDHAVMDAILKCGLDPNCRRPGLTHDFFGSNYNRSLIYTKMRTVSSPSCYKLLVFLIISEPSDFLGSQFFKTEICTMSSSNKLQLQLAEISL
ncbi:unnamed protein product [Calypogeia fissa]